MKHYILNVDNLGPDGELVVRQRDDLLLKDIYIEIRDIEWAIELLVHD